jgi:uncharacterized membrane protein
MRSWSESHSCSSSFVLISAATPRAEMCQLISHIEPLPRFFPLERVIAFSDGVFAIVLTILVLGIEVPSDVALDAAAMALQRETFLHQLLVYGVAFCLIAMYWVQHSLLFAGLRQMDRVLAVLNLLLLLPVTLLPFVTQLMGARRDDWRGVLVFAVTNLFAAFLFERLWNHVAAQPETHKDQKTALLARRVRWGTRFFGVVLIAGVLVSRLDVQAGILIILVMPFVYFLNLLRDPLGSDTKAPSRGEGD